MQTREMNQNEAVGVLLNQAYKRRELLEKEIKGIDMAIAALLAKPNPPNAATVRRVSKKKQKR